jgi:membrane-associated protease RseP (regulator of RpoE activity)
MPLHPLLVKSAELYLPNNTERIKFVTTTLTVYSNELIQHLRPDDFPGMLLPLLYPNSNGKTLTGCVLALKDRAILTRHTGRLGLKIVTTVVPYTSVTATRKENFDNDGQQLEALRVSTTAGDHLLVFPNVAHDVKYRGILAGVLDQSLKLAWESSPAPEPETKPQPRRLGANVSTETAAEGGLEVRRVQPDSLAARAGLQTGDLLVKIGETPIASAVDIQTGLAQAPDPVAIAYSRQGETYVVNVGLS